MRAASVYFATGKAHVSFDPDLVDLDVLMGEDGLVIAATLEVAADRMETDGKTAILAGWDGEVLVIAVAETVKDDAAAAVTALRKR